MRLRSRGGPNMKKFLAVLALVGFTLGGSALAQDKPAPATPAADKPAAAAAAAADATKDEAKKEEPKAEAKPGPTPNKGDVAWMLTSTALVLMMSVPALALF